MPRRPAHSLPLNLFAWPPSSKTIAINQNHARIPQMLRRRAFKKIQDVKIPAQAFQPMPIPINLTLTFRIFWDCWPQELCSAHSLPTCTIASTPPISPILRQDQQWFTPTRMSRWSIIIWSWLISLRISKVVKHSPKMSKTYQNNWTIQTCLKFTVVKMQTCSVSQTWTWWSWSQYRIDRMFCWERSLRVCIKASPDSASSFGHSACVVSFCIFLPYFWQGGQTCSVVLHIVSWC